MKKVVGEEIKKLDSAISGEIDRLISSIDDVELNSTNMMILEYLADNKEKTIYQRDVQSISSLPKATLSLILNDLEEKGLVKRTMATDQRFKEITITEQGEAVVKKYDEAIESLDKELRNNVSDDELYSFFEILDKIKKSILKKGSFGSPS